MSFVCSLSSWHVYEISNYMDNFDPTVALKHRILYFKE